MKKQNHILMVAALLFSATSSFAQAAQPVETSPYPEWMTSPLFWLLTLLILIMSFTIYALYRANLMLLKIAFPHAAIEKEKPAAAVEVKNEKPSMARRIYLRLVDSVPVSEEKDVLMDHDYDGIRELDNNLPPWWKYGFYATIVFACLYLLVYHVSGRGKLQADEYRDELVLAEQQREARMKAAADYVTEENVVALNDVDGITRGKEAFQKLCVACHRADGGGQVGPNLTDEYWIHGGGIKNIFKTITHGVQEKGMISWKSQLSPKQIQQVSSYILTLAGSNPQGAKEAQGDKWAGDSTTTTAVNSSTDTTSNKQN